MSIPSPCIPDDEAALFLMADRLSYPNSRSKRKLR